MSDLYLISGVVSLGGGLYEIGNTLSLELGGSTVATIITGGSVGTPGLADVVVFADGDGLYMITGVSSDGGDVYTIPDVISVGDGLYEIGTVLSLIVGGSAVALISGR